RKALKYSAASFLAAVRSRVNFSRTNGSWGIASSRTAPARGRAEAVGAHRVCRIAQELAHPHNGQPCRSFQKRNHPSTCKEGALRPSLRGEASPINKREHSAIRQVDATQTRRSCVMKNIVISVALGASAIFASSAADA